MATVRATRRPVPKALDDILKAVDEATQRLRHTGVSAAPAARGQETLLRDEPAGSRPGATPPRPGVPVSDRKSQKAGSASPVPAPLEQTSAPPAETAAGWPRVVDEVMRRKPTLGAVLAQSVPGSLRDGELTIVLSGNHFHREMLADNANRDVVVQALRRNLAGVERFRVSAENDGGGGVATHPAVQAAVAEFQGEVVAVRPRSTEGEGQ